MRNKHNHVNLSAAPFSTVITSLSHDGRGIASSPVGKTTFIDGALLNEEVKFVLTKKHKRYNEGEAIEIITASPDRVKPECQHFGVCGGCSLQHLAMPAQIALKQKILLEQLKHFGRVEPEIILPPISGNEWGYRRKARIGVRYVENKGKIVVGFRKKSSQTLTEIETCLVLHPSVGLHIAEIRELVNSLSQREHIPQIEVAIGDHASALIFRVMKDLSAEDENKLAEFGKKWQLEILLQPNPPAPLKKIWPAEVTQLNYALPDYQLEMLYSPLDFTQVNGEINALMVKQALMLLEPNDADEILDLFCGLGNFTLPIARFAKHVTGIEGGVEMVTRGKENALHNKILNTEFHAANLSVIPAAKPAWMKKQYDKILLDPPRTGAKEIIEYFPKFSAKRIVYVSCNPATLARDAGELVHNQGFKLKKLGVINMFPHTSHIEAIALFEK